MQANQQKRTKRLSRSTWKALVDEYKAGALNAGDYCKLKGIRQNRLRHWEHKLLQESRTSPPRFLPVNLQATKTSGARGASGVSGIVEAGLVIRLPNGIIMEIEKQPAPKVLTHVFKLLGIRPC